MQETEAQVQATGEDGNPVDPLIELALRFVSEREQFVRDRKSSGLEERWLADYEFYQGLDTQQRASMVANIEAGGSQPARANEKETRSRVVVNITRPKTNAAEARLSDMLLPVDERNWGIKPTPVPELAEMTQDQSPVVDQGQPVMVAQEGGERQMTVADRAREVAAEAKKRADAMANEIDDQLTECDFNSVERDVIRSATMYGLGILKGPVVRNRMRKAWMPLQDGAGNVVHQLKMIEDKRPWSECPSVWDVYWDMSCGNELDACSAIWERKYVSPRQLRELARSEGYMPDKIAQVLKEGPSRVRTHDERRTADSKLGYQPPEDRNFEMWERHGEVTRAQLIACKCSGVEEATEENGLDELDAISATLVFVNETPIKAFLNPLESGEMIYDFFQWEKQENSLAGFGVPYLLRQASQRMVTAATRMLMDNSGRSAGPQVVVRRGLVEPANKRWEITGNKLWFMKEDGASVKDVFGVYQIGTNTADYMAIIQLALKFADEEISLPMIMAGERGSAPSQVGSMQMLMNSATVVLRRLVKRFDGQITRRHIRRYYDYNMQFNPKSEIKGDYEVDARGSTALMQRDLANQGLQKWLAALTNQALAVYFDAEKMIRKSLQADYIVPDDVMAETAEIKRRLKVASEAQPQPSPDAMVRAQAQVKSAEMAGAAKAGETQARLEDAERQRQHELLLKAIDSDLTLKELANEEGVNLDKVRAELAKAAMQIRAARESFLEEVALKQAMGSGI